MAWDTKICDMVVTDIGKHFLKKRSVYCVIIFTGSATKDFCRVLSVSENVYPLLHEISYYLSTCH